MSEAAAWVLVALAALLVGTAVPVLIQLRKTLKAAEETLQSTGQRVNDALDKLGATLERANRAVGALESGMERASGLFDSLAAAGDALAKVRKSVGAVASIGSIVGSALIAALGFKSSAGAQGADRAEPVTAEEEAS